MASFTTASGNTAFANPRICPDEARAAVGFTISSAVGARTTCESGCGITPATKSAPNMRQIGRRTPFPRRKSRPLIAIGVCLKDRFDAPPDCSFLSLTLKPVPRQLGKLAMLANCIGIGVGRACFNWRACRTEDEVKTSWSDPIGLAAVEVSRFAVGKIWLSQKCQ